MGALEEGSELCNSAHHYCSHRDILHAQQEYAREYSSDEEELQRHMIWEANKNYVDNHNEHAHVFGFILTMNKFADLVSLSACHCALD